MRRGSSLLVLALGLLGSSAAWAVTYNEAVNGDLSGDRNAPTALVLAVGSNPITATSAAGDIEYFRLTLPPGGRLSAINVVSSTSTSLSFIAVQPGTTFTEPPTGTVVSHLLGYAHFGPGNGTVGANILGNMGVGAGAIGFVPPLVASDYTFWSQETSSVASTYKLDFVVTQASPAPLGRTAAAALALALLMLGAWRLRRRARA